MIYVRNISSTSNVKERDTVLFTGSLDIINSGGVI